MTSTLGAVTATADLHKDSDVVDIDKIVRRWASRDHGADSVVINDWSKVRCSSSGNISFSEKKSGSPNSGGDTVFDSIHENNTDGVQNHTFTMERTTEATLKTNVIQGFSINGDIGISIPVPDHISNTTGAFGSEIMITEEDEHTSRHKLVWRINTTFKSPPRSKTVGRLTIKHETFSCRFEGDVFLRGIVVVRVQKSGSEALIQEDIVTILRDEIDSGRFQPATRVSIQGNKVKWRCVGYLHFRYGTSQNMAVWSES